jgi:hypothetical protein
MADDPRDPEAVDADQQADERRPENEEREPAPRDAETDLLEDDRFQATDN